MRFYKATAFLFPNSYESRILLICFAAAQLPLLAYVAIEEITGEWQIATLVTLLLATPAGAGIGLVAVHALLRPVADAAAMLGTIQKGERVARIPRAGNDLVGRLMRIVRKAADESVARAERMVGPAERDYLTGIRNRQCFLSTAETILRGEHNAVLAVVDIDHFKLINDQFGEEAGDNLLRALAQRLAQGIRRSDIIARWGGNQFSMLLPDTMLDEARMVLERLRAAVALDETLGEHGWPITFSCGLAPIREFSQFGEAAAKAEAALDEAKSGGKNRILALVD